MVKTLYLSGKGDRLGFSLASGAKAGPVRQGTFICHQRFVTKFSACTIRLSDLQNLMQG